VLRRAAGAYRTREPSPNGLLGNVAPSDAPALFDALEGKPASLRQVNTDLPFFKMQMPIVLENSGMIEAERIESYIAAGGYQALCQALHEMTPAAVVEEITGSGLRGRGGAGYPTGVNRAPSWTKVSWKATRIACWKGWPSRPMPWGRARDSSTSAATMPVRTLTIDNRLITAPMEQTILEAAEQNGVKIPTLCHLEGITDVGACRLCLVEIAGTGRLLPACVTQVAEGMEVHTNTERLAEYRKMIVELFFAERNHVCSVCVANGHCELQDMAARVGMDHVRLEYQFPKLPVDVSPSGSTTTAASSAPAACAFATRLKALTLGTSPGAAAIAGSLPTSISPGGEAASCTACGKCVQACPTGALFRQGSTVAEMQHDKAKLGFLITAREKKQWLA
jgi:bidirectional [NiFe] hydrogenase diaphorase subunit